MNTNNPYQAEGSFDTTRRHANEALERASDRARDLANRGMSSVTDAASTAQRQISQYAQATGRYVAEQPMKSALIAAAVGAAVAALVLIVRRNSSRNNYY
ncbi:hypothetical protein [Ramlibacter sp.]|uniref:hypothetical protein n=1 Tax=Ramlibacter sp. TaxID=1917967 RepID=UPI0017D32162|nr:hypothetical protein [Ramlibacter sp.]MBA2674866.1 DUF883 family protein [Ramlibacter sp.]